MHITFFLACCVILRAFWEKKSASAEFFTSTKDDIPWMVFIDTRVSDNGCLSGLFALRIARLLYTSVSHRLCTRRQHVYCLRFHLPGFPHPLESLPLRWEVKNTLFIRIVFFCVVPKCVKSTEVPLWTCDQYSAMPGRYCFFSRFITNQCHGSRWGQK